MWRSQAGHAHLVPGYVEEHLVLRTLNVKAEEVHRRIVQGQQQAGQLMDDIEIFKYLV